MTKRIMIIISTLLLVFTFTGCKDENDTSFSGAYNGSTVEVLGEDTPVSEVFTKGETSVTLNDDCTGFLTVDGTVFKISFTIEGEKITISAADGNEDSVCQGTLSGNTLKFPFFDLGFNMTFIR